MENIKKKWGGYGVLGTGAIRWDRWDKWDRWGKIRKIGKIGRGYHSPIVPIERSVTHLSHQAKRSYLSYAPAT